MGIRAVPGLEIRMAVKRPVSSMYARRELARVRLRRLNRERAALLERFPDLAAPGRPRLVRTRQSARRSR
jgi:hypothetical protein